MFLTALPQILFIICLTSVECVIMV